MKVLFTSYPFAPLVGGIEINSEVLAGGFAGKPDVELVLVTQTPGDAGRAFPFQVVRAPGRRELWNWHRWADLVFQNHVSIELLWPAILLRKPVVATLCTWIDHLASPRQVWMRNWALRRVDARIAISQALADKAPGPCTVIGNPYRSEIFRMTTPFAEREGVAFVGRLVSDKGCADLLEALGKLRGQGHSLPCGIFGDGPERASLERQVRDLKLSGVTFYGSVSPRELAEHLNRYRILAAPSRWSEPFGNVALEGVGCGCVVVVPDSGGLPDAMGPCGLTFRPGNLDDLADKIRVLSVNDALCSELLAGRDAHLERHEASAIVDGCWRVVEEVRQRRGVAR